MQKFGVIAIEEEIDRSRVAARSEKSIRHGHPSTLHLWWARRPLATARAVLFASLVDDPSSRTDLYPTVEEQDRKRAELFKLLGELVRWENSSNADVLKQARDEIMLSTDGNPPEVLDPFAGGGTIPLEAQRLGLRAHAFDLNPVAVLITARQSRRLEIARRVEDIFRSAGARRRRRILRQKIEVARRGKNRQFISDGGARRRQSRNRDRMDMGADGEMQQSCVREDHAARSFIRAVEKAGRECRAER